MPKTKPRAVPRRPRVDPTAAAALEERISKNERGSESSIQGESDKRPVSERPDAQTSKRSGATRQKRPPKPKGPGVTWREGRLLADGSRRGAGWVRRMTIYLPPELARKLDVEAAERGEDKSTIIAEMLVDGLDRLSRR